jgi:flagellar motor switch protein FliM
LEKGDVISVEMPDTVTLNANGVPVFETRLGVSRGNLALQVVGQIDKE